MGVGVEYYSNAVAFFERMRQIEENASLVLGNFSPMSWLLMSDRFIHYLRLMLLEGLPDEKDSAAVDYIDRVLKILAERQQRAKTRKTAVVSLIRAQDIEQLLRNGLVGRFGLPKDVVKERRMAAKEEIERLIEIMQSPPIGIQVGVLEGSTSTQSFQLFEQASSVSVSLSPFRLGDQPNVSTGIAMITSAPEAVRLFRETLSMQWEKAFKGERGAKILRELLKQPKDFY